MVSHAAAEQREVLDGDVGLPPSARVRRMARRAGDDPALRALAPPRLEDSARFLYLANVFDRFSVVAALSVAVILATGTFNGLAAVPTAGAMIHTTYGRVLLVKIGLLMPLLAVAGLNAFILKPRFVAAIDTLYQQGGIRRRATRARWTPQLRRLATARADGRHRDRVHRRDLRRRRRADADRDGARRDRVGEGGVGGAAEVRAAGAREAASTWTSRCPRTRWA